MRSLFLDSSIKHKIVTLFYLFFAIFVTLFFFYNQLMTSKRIVDKVGSANLYLLEQISSNVAFMREEIEDMSAQLVVHPQIQNYLNSNNNHEIKEEKLYVDIDLRNAINLIVSKDYISSLAILGFENNSVPFLSNIDSQFKLPTIDKLDDMSFFSDAVEAKGKPIWLDSPSDTYIFAENSRYNRVLMIRIVREYYSYENMGMIVIGISEPALRQAYTKGIDTDNCSIAIFDNNNQIISRAGRPLDLKPEVHNEIEQENQGYKNVLLDDQQLLLSYTTDESTGWTYLYGVPMNNLAAEINSYRNYVLMFIIVCLFLFFPLVVFSSDLIVRPIKKLLEAMKKFQTGDFEAKVNFRYKDEIGQLGDGYNEMVDNIKNLIEQMYLIEIKEQEAELTALQSQINPHFLYNTLDSIYWKALKNSQNEIAEMVWSLSNLFRISLNKGNRFNTVSHEFTILELYLRLQQLRYGDKLSYEINLDPQIAVVKIPKLIVQPFVENAIYHGIEQIDSPGVIIITCLKEEDYIKLLISDNGAGMDNDTLTQLNEGQSPSNDANGYAIWNIQERLCIVYGDDHRLTISSVRGKGTDVELMLPIDLPKED